jgi:hypothetical protein
MHPAFPSSAYTHFSLDIFFSNKTGIFFNSFIWPNQEEMTVEQGLLCFSLVLVNKQLKFTRLFPDSTVGSFPVSTWNFSRKEITNNK